MSELRDAAPLPPEVAGRVSSAIREEVGGAWVTRITHQETRTRFLTCFEVNGEWSVMVKHSPFDWVAARFRSAKVASSLAADEGSVVTPACLPLPERVGGTSVLAYWYVPLPTLESLWPALSPNERDEAVRSLGRLLRRLHRVAVPRHGSLVDDEHVDSSLAAFLERDLRRRLKPAVCAHWPDGVPLVERALERVDEGDPDGAAPALTHNDLHLGNVLCRRRNGRVQCVGLLDLEAAAGGRAESDLASASVLHDPLFAQEYGTGDWLGRFDRALREGYGDGLDPRALGFFRLYHLLNLGFASALTGDHWHADRVAPAVERTLEGLA